MDSAPNFDAALVKALRKDRGWTQAELADFLGCSQPTVSKIEKGADISRPYRKLLASLVITSRHLRSAA